MSSTSSSDLTAAGRPRSPAAEWVVDFTRHETRSRRRDQAIIWLERLGIVVIALGAWQALVALKVIDANSVGEPSGVISYFFGTLLPDSGFWHAVALTTEEMILGLICGVAAGALLGLVLGLVPRLTSAVQPLIVGVNAVPKIALAPLAVVWFGLGIPSKVAIAALGTFFVIFFNVVGGLADQDRALVQNARVLGISRLRILRMVTLPSIGVWVVTALKVAISLSMVGAVVSEYIGANAGLGYEINAAINTVQVTRMMALLAAVCIIGCAAYGVVSILEKMVLRWR